MKASSVTKYVAGFLFCEDAVLLIQKARPDWQKGKLNGIGGHVEPGETSMQAMRREFREETGFTVSGWEHFATLCGEGVPRSKTHAAEPYEVAFFRATCPSGTARDVAVDTDEPVFWINALALPSTVLPNLRYLIPMAFHAHREEWPLVIIEPPATQKRRVK